MRRIGTTSEGGALLEVSKAELAVIKEAGDLLSELLMCAVVHSVHVGALPKDIEKDLVRVSFAKKPKAGKRSPAAKDPAGKITCTVCGVLKPASDYYGKDKQCKLCRLARQRLKKAEKAAFGGDSRAARRAHGLAVVARVQKTVKDGGTFAPRERDPDLDRPVSGGRVEQVGGEG